MAISSFINSAFIGVPGLPGVSGNSNPFSFVQDWNSESAVKDRADQARGTLDAIGSWLSGNNVGDNITEAADNVLSGVMPGGGEEKSSGGLGALISDFFLRSVIIILGFIFVAVGLSMFRNSKR